MFVALRWTDFNNSITKLYRVSCHNNKKRKTKQLSLIRFVALELCEFEKFLWSYIFTLGSKANYCFRYSVSVVKTISLLLCRSRIFCCSVHCMEMCIGFVSIYLSVHLSDMHASDLNSLLSDSVHIKCCVYGWFLTLSSALSSSHFHSLSILQCAPNVCYYQKLFFYFFAQSTIQIQHKMISHSTHAWLKRCLCTAPQGHNSYGFGFSCYFFSQSYSIIG